MKLTVQDVGRMFGAPERQIERWIRDEGMPHHRVHGQDFFHHAELLEWANARGIRIAAEAPASVRPPAGSPGFADALAAGGIHHGVPAADRETLLRAVVERLPETSDLDRDLLFEILLARESAGSSGIGEGIAIPHVRAPIVADVDHAFISLCFLDRPIDFGAIDGKPVHTVFTIIAPSIRAHLSLLAKLSATLHDPEVREAMSSRAPAGRILAAARRAELAFGLRSSGAPAEGGEDGDREEAG
jgi:PTS system nitrogen regulatory IIA component